MTLQASGSISLADLAGEFGGTAPHSLNEYYRNGIYVLDTAANQGIPVSGAISIDGFYGSSSAYSIVGSADPNSETYIAGPNASVLSKVTDGNLNTFAGVKYPSQSFPSAGSDPTRFSVVNTDIKTGVQNKIGTSVPASASAFASFGLNGVTVTGWVMASFDGSFYTMDGKTKLTFLDSQGTSLGVKELSDSNITSFPGTGWQWRSYSMTARNGLFPFGGTSGDDKMAKWVHGGCKIEVERTTAVYSGLPAVSDIQYNLDFSAS